MLMYLGFLRWFLIFNEEMLSLTRSGTSAEVSRSSGERRYARSAVSTSLLLMMSWYGK